MGEEGTGSFSFALALASRIPARFHALFTPHNSPGPKPRDLASHPPAFKVQKQAPQPLPAARIEGSNRRALFRLPLLRSNARSMRRHARRVATTLLRAGSSTIGGMSGGGGAGLGGAVVVARAVGASASAAGGARTHLFSSLATRRWAGPAAAVSSSSAALHAHRHHHPHASTRRHARLSSPVAAGHVEVRVASMGESITEGSVVAILAPPGTAVEEDAVIAQIETDKVTIDVRAPRAGVVQQVLVKPDESVVVGQLVAILGDEGKQEKEMGMDGEGRGGGEGGTHAHAHAHPHVCRSHTQP